MVFSRSLSDSQLLQIRKTFLRILAILSNAVIHRVLILYLISSFISLFYKAWAIVANATPTVHIDCIIIYPNFLVLWFGPIIFLFFHFLLS